MVLRVDPPFRNDNSSASGQPELRNIEARYYGDFETTRQQPYNTKPDNTMK